MYRVKDVMSDDVHTCSVDDTLETAVRIMNERGCGCVPVVDHRSRLMGLVTDREALLCALRTRRPLEGIPVRDACSNGVISCDAEDALERAEQLMRVNRVRRLAVLGRDHEVVGVISLVDLARHVELSSRGDETGLSPRHIAVVLAETSGAPRLHSTDEHRRRSAGVAHGTDEHRRRNGSGPHPIVEPFFHG